MALASRSFRWAVNPDGTRDGHYPNGDKPPGATLLAWGDLSALAALIVQRNTGSAFSQDVRQYLTGTDAATATISIVQVSGDNAATEGWAISTDNLTHPGDNTGAGAFKLRATTSGNSVDSEALAWSWVAAPVGDSLAPTIPTRLTASVSGNSITPSCDAPCDPHDGSSAGTGVKEIELRKNGVLVQTKSVSAGLSLAYTVDNIGTSTPAPSFNQTGAAWTLSGGGAGFDGVTDQFPFAHATVSGDFTATVTIDSFTSAASQFSKLGLMVRESVTAGSKLAAIYYMASVGRVQVKTRTATGGSSTSTTGIDIALPLKLQIKREGDLVTRSYRNVDDTWTDLDSTTLPLTSAVEVGFFVTSQVNGTSVSGAISNLCVNNAARVTFTPISSSSAITLDVRARDLATPANVSAYSPTITATPVGVSSAVKFNSGHGMIINDYTQYGDPGYNPTHITDLISEPNVESVLVRVYWKALEQSKGSYDFTVLDEIFSVIRSAGKKMILQVQDRTFSGSGTTSYFPAYLSSEGLLHTKGNGGYVVKYWLAPGMDYLLALFNAIASHPVPGTAYTYDTHPDFEAITNCESSVPAQPPPSDWSTAISATQLKRYMTGVVAAFPHTNAFVSLNYLSGQMEGLVAHAVANRCGIAGPDTVPNAPTDAQYVVMGKHENGSNGGIDYRGRVPIMFQVQGPELGGKEGTFTMSAIGAAGATYGSTHMPWLRATFASPRPTWSADILPYLHGTPVALETDCPSSYPSCTP